MASGRTLSGTSWARAVQSSPASIRPVPTDKPTKDGISRDRNGFISINTTSRQGGPLEFRCPNHVPHPTLKHLSRHSPSGCSVGGDESYFLPGIIDKTLMEMILIVCKKPSFWKVDDRTDKQILLFREFDRQIGISGLEESLPCNIMVVVAKRNGWLVTAYPVPVMFTPEYRGSTRSSTPVSTNPSSGYSSGISTPGSTSRGAVNMSRVADKLDRERQVNSRQTDDGYDSSAQVGDGTDLKGLRVPNRVSAAVMESIIKRHGQDTCKPTYFLSKIPIAKIIDMILETCQTPDRCHLDAGSSRKVYRCKKYEGVLGKAVQSQESCSWLVVISKRNGWITAVYPAVIPA